ncbi:zinc knuckle CX2CX4HX4C containing protein [Tanacetum coccineum]
MSYRALFRAQSLLRSSNFRRLAVRAYGRNGNVNGHGNSSSNREPFPWPLTLPLPPYARTASRRNLDVLLFDLLYALQQGEGGQEDHNAGGGAGTQIPLQFDLEGLGDLAGMEKSSNTNLVKVSTTDGEDLMRNVSIANEPAGVSSWLINETNVETLFGVKFTSLSDIDDFSMSITEGKYADILSTMSSADIDAVVNVTETIRKKFRMKLTRLVVRNLVVVQSIDVAATFGVPLTTVGDLHKLINDIEAGKHIELLSGMTNDDRMETLDALAGARTMAQPQVNSNFRPWWLILSLMVLTSLFPVKLLKRQEKKVTAPKVGLEAVLESGHWMIRNTLIILKKWSMSTSLLKEELTRIPIWVKLHDVPLQVFKEDVPCVRIRGGRSSFAWCLIEVKSEADLVDSVTIGIPSLTGDDFTKETIRVEYEWRPPKCDECKIFGHVHDHCPKKMVIPPIVTTSNVVAPTVEKSNDGFQTVGKKKKRKGKSKSTNGYQFTSSPVKQTVRYEPKATTSAPKKGATNVSNPSKSSSMLKTADTSPKNDNFTTSNSFSTLNDEEVENVYDELANLVPNTNTCGSSYFTAAAAWLGIAASALASLELKWWLSKNPKESKKWPCPRQTKNYNELKFVFPMTGMTITDIHVRIPLDNKMSVIGDNNHEHHEYWVDLPCEGTNFEKEYLERS